MRIVRDIVYREIDGQELRLDLHLPDGEPTVRGTVVYFHGGGFMVGERTDMEEKRAQVLVSHGIPVVTVQYRLSGVARFPAQRDDAQAAIQWIRENAAQYGFSADSVGAWGASAGGTLAAWLGLGSPREGLKPDVDAVVSWFPVTDFKAVTGASPLEREILSTDESDALFGGRWDESNPVHLAGDPVRNVSADAAPFFLVTGDRDRVIEPAQSYRLHDALVLAGAHSQLLIVGGAGHEAEAIEAASVLGAVAAFFREHLAS